MFVQNPKLLAAAELVVHLNLPLLPTSRELWFGMLPIWDADAFGGVATRQSNSVSRDDDFNIPQAWVSHLRFMHLLVVLVPVCLKKNHWKLQGLRSPWLNLWLAFIKTSKKTSTCSDSHFRSFGIFHVFVRMWPQQSERDSFQTGFPEFLYCLVLKHGRGGDACVCGTMEWNMMMEQQKGARIEISWSRELFSREKVWGDGLVMIEHIPTISRIWSPETWILNPPKLGNPQNLQFAMFGTGLSFFFKQFILEELPSLRSSPFVLATAPYTPMPCAFVRRHGEVQCLVQMGERGAQVTWRNRRQWDDRWSCQWKPWHNWPLHEDLRRMPGTFYLGCPKNCKKNSLY